MGDINGVGPEIIAKALANPYLWAWCRPLVVGSARVLDELRVFSSSTCPATRVIGHPSELEPDYSYCPVIQTDDPVPSRQPGIIDPAAGRCAVEWTKTAVRLAMEGSVAGLVTCPLNKEGIHRAGYHYAGHTELVAEMTNSPDYRMCLFAGGMRVVHITSHMSMRDAIAAVKTDRIVKSIQIGHNALLQLGLNRRRIAVAGLNPHAGEARAFGDEDENEIIPAINICRADGIDCSGPHPADTLFRRMHEGQFDLVVAMYHDQGHIPVKLIALDEGVNVTLGIPIIRTSVDHGTAYDIAGTGQARELSLLAAVQLAAQFATGVHS